jgi:predicted acetyltransferase
MREQYEEFLRDFLEAGEEVFGYNNRRKRLENIEVTIQSLCDEARGLKVRDGWVPMSNYWCLVNDSSLVGDVAIRHKLTPTLEDMGGNIDYAVRPRCRRQGFATTMLMLALKEAQALGLKSVLITCDSDNIASHRVIQKNGGMFISQSPSSNQTPGYNDILTARYRIVL